MIQIDVYNQRLRHAVVAQLTTNVDDQNDPACCLLKAGTPEGNSAGILYGATKGLGRFVFRMGMGIYEIATHNFATYKGSYRPPYKSNIPWIHGGYEEFPPELGFESRYRYTRNYSGW